jgi:adenylylsulfate kinase
MPQDSRHHWPGWSTISATANSSFTLWLTGLPGTGKSTLAMLVKMALLARGHKVEIIDMHALSRWLKHELHFDEELNEDRSHTVGYDPFITYICTLLAHNRVITITSSVSPHLEARDYARDQIRRFIEVYLFCPSEPRQQRLHQQESSILFPAFPEHLYEPPTQAELNIDTSLDSPERSALRVVTYLEQQGYITPVWEQPGDETEEELETIKARLRALGYLD